MEDPYSFCWSRGLCSLYQMKKKKIRQWNPAIFCPIHSTIFCVWFMYANILLYIFYNTSLYTSPSIFTFLTTRPTGNQETMSWLPLQRLITRTKLAWRQTIFSTRRHWASLGDAVWKPLDTCILRSSVHDSVTSTAQGHITQDDIATNVKIFLKNSRYLNRNTTCRSGYFTDKKMISIK